MHSFGSQSSHFSPQIFSFAIPAHSSTLPHALYCLASYFVARHLIQDEQDVLSASKALVAVGAIASAAMVVEQLAHINLLRTRRSATPSGDSRRPLSLASNVCALHHCGCYGATLFPLGIWLWIKGQSLKLYARVAIVCSY